MKKYRIVFFPVTMMFFALLFSGCEKSDEGELLQKKAKFTNPLVTDLDGNVYKTVNIGNQVWMVENLKTTKYRDGSGIENVTDYASWVNLVTGAYCWYNNDTTNKSTYGALYNWYAVNDSRKLAPIGWHVPTGAEWTILQEFLGGYLVAGGKLKEEGTLHWLNPNTGATNESGFTALPGGELPDTGGFYGMGLLGYWWGSDLYGTFFGMSSPYYSLMQFNTDLIAVASSWYQSNGHSVRCLKDDVPVLTTTQVSNISSSEALSGGEILTNSGQKIKSCGVCWSASPHPSVKNFKTIEKPVNSNSAIESMNGVGPYESQLRGLKANTTYYVRAYAVNSLGTAYGDEVTFTTN